MNVGDLVRVKWNFATSDPHYKLHKKKIGMVVRIERRYYEKPTVRRPWDRITVLWTSGVSTREPETYLVVLK